MIVTLMKKLLENEKLKNEKVQAQYDELEVSYTNLKTATAISLNGSDVKETKQIVDGFIVPQPAPECKVPAGKNHDRLPKTFAVQKHDRMHKK